MPLRNQITTKLSARSVYAKKAAKNETVERRGRPRKIPITSPKNVKTLLTEETIAKKALGRPKKHSVSPVKKKSNLRKKSSPKTRKRKSSVSFKGTTEIIQNNSSEADLSSEGEENDLHNDDVVTLSNEDKVSSDEVKNEEESSGEEGDVEEDIGGDEEVEDEEEGEENGESVHNLDEEALETENLEGDSEDDENVWYSFPESTTQSATDAEMTNTSEKDIDDSEITNEEKNEVQFRNKVKQKKIQSNKRKNISENDVEEEELEENSHMLPKSKKMARADLSLDGDSTFSAPYSRAPSFCPQRLFNQNRASTSSIRNAAMSPQPRIDSIDSLIRFNKSVPCGNVAADQAFRWLISPSLPVDFYHNMFEKSPFTVQRENHNYYKDLFSGNDLNTMLKEHHLEYGIHIDVVKYVKETRIPVAADGRAYYSNVWEDYKQGYSVRVRKPQAYNKNLYRLCSLLQEYFSSTVGCNTYLTPPKAQGFPPHYDDIDAFIIQVEGRKYWKIYAPRYAGEELARYSSKDFAQDEIGDPIIEVCLNAGEMLYIPRGFIHQAETDRNSHSLHLTFSANQLNTWGDLLLIAVSGAIEKAILTDVTFRESLPRDYMDYLGSSVADSKAFKRYELVNKAKDLAKKAMSYIDVDEAADQHSAKFIQSSLPPVLSKIERERSTHGNGSYWKNGEIRLKGMIEENTEIQLIKKRALRLVIGDNQPRLYHTFENQKDPKLIDGEEPLATYIDFEMEGVPAYLFLLNKFPDFIRVKDLPIKDLDDKLSFATSLYDNGLIMTKQPLPRRDDDFD